MIGKALFLLVVATALVQSYVPQNLQGELDIEALGGPIDTLKSLVQGAIDKAKDSLAKLKVQFGEQIKSIVAQAKQSLNNEYTELIEELNELKQQAKALGLDIVDCLKAKEQQLKDLPKVYAQKIVQCGEDKYNAGKLIIDSAKISVENSIQIVKDLTKKFNECGGGFSGGWCKTKVGAEILKATAEVPVNVIAVATDAIPYVNSLYPDLQKCTVNVGKDFLNEGNSIIHSIQTCIQSKIKPQNSTLYE